MLRLNMLAMKNVRLTSRQVRGPCSKPLKCQDIRRSLPVVSQPTAVTAFTAGECLLLSGSALQLYVIAVRRSTVDFAPSSYPIKEVRLFASPQKEGDVFEGHQSG
jgi:hypothetical protein